MGKVIVSKTSFFYQIFILIITRSLEEIEKYGIKKETEPKLITLRLCQTSVFKRRK